MSLYFDPEAIYQDADIEMMELAEAAESSFDPWKECGWCHQGNQNGVATVQYFNGARLITEPYCNLTIHRIKARQTKKHFEELYG